jgi:opacity protein-like surface antigen
MTARAKLCYLVLIIFCGSLFGADDDVKPTPDKPNPGQTKPLKENPEKDKKEEGINWKAVLLESGFFLGIEHGFRLYTEQGTRDGLKGPFIQNYVNSVTNLHGWADGDPFLVNYVGHPMQGAVSGFILVQNDPKGKSVEFGNNPVYWKSRFKAMAYAWAYSEQFEIGPLSEASLGRVQSYFPQQGFVDQVITPFIGTGWLLAEDFLDKYVIKRVEDHTENVFVRMMVRGWLNPSRSMANAMALRVPWARDTRAGIWSYRHQTSVDPSAAVLNTERYHSINEIPPIRLNLHYNFGQGPSSTPCNGGGMEGQFTFSKHVSGVIDIAGCKALFSNKDLSGDSLTYMAGLRFSRQLTDRWTIYGHALAGGNKMTTELFFPLIKKLTPSAGEDDWVSHAKYTTGAEMNAFSTAVGGGAEYTLSNAWAIRIGNLDYVHNWSGSHSDYMPENSIRFSSGVVLRLGTW